MKIKLQDIVGQPVGFGECLVGKTAQHLLVIFQNQAGSLQDFGLRASESDGSLGNPVVFRMFQGIVKVQGISGQFTAEDLTGKLPERPVVEKDAGGKDQKKSAGRNRKVRNEGSFRSRIEAPENFWYYFMIQRADSCPK